MIPIVTNFEDELVALRDLLASRDERLVLVESCTSGLVGGILGQIPGISQYFCGSLVVYRNDSKRRWLGIDSAMLNDPAIGPVSKTVTEALASAALDRTPEATLAAAITGHLGPEAPLGMDGLVFTCVHPRAAVTSAIAVRHHLKNPAPRDREDSSFRQQRQLEAVHLLVAELKKHLEGTPIS
jgi:nicotinamide-nucleotide amidase